MKKYIKYSFNKLKKYIHTYEASPLFEVKDKRLKTTRLSLNIKNKKKNFYYIIRRTPGAGFFSNFIYVLNHLKIADRLNYKPVVDMENFPTIYNESVYINGTKNAWNYYFQEKSNYNLKKIYKKENYFLTNNVFNKSFSHNIDSDDFRKIFKKYFNIKKEYLDLAEKFYNKNFLNEKVLAIHLRGTSYKTSANHPFPTTIKQSINLINNLKEKYNFTKLFLCTDDLAYFDKFHKKFQNEIIFIKNSYRSYKDDAFKIYPRKKHRYKMGKDILIEALLMSKCNGFVYTNSNVSEFVKFLDKKNIIKYFAINNGFNSSNEYIANWLWYYKNLVPSFLGGFVDKVDVK